MKKNIHELCVLFIFFNGKYNHSARTINESNCNLRSITAYAGK